MNPETSPKLRSTIVKVPDASPGLLFLNGQQKSFTLEGVWKSPVAPAPNMTVDVDLDGAGSIAAITVVDSQQIAKERLNQLSGVAQERGKEAAKLAQQGIGALAARMGAVPLGAAVLLWVSWFFLPAASVEGGGPAPISLTFWNLLGTDFNNPESILRGGNEHGFFAFLGFLCIAAPFAAPFIRAAWSKYLNAAPFAFFLIGFISIYLNVNKTFGDMVKAGITSPFSWSWGVFVVGLAALVLAAGALKKPAIA
ncbi:MAG: hypothetical protein ACHQLQ_09145 [Candidatus Acidiferrales bacterium]